MGQTTGNYCYHDEFQYDMKALYVSINGKYQHIGYICPYCWRVKRRSGVSF